MLLATSEVPNITRLMGS